VNSLLLFILGLSAFACLALLIRRKRQVLVCRIVAGLCAVGLLISILDQEDMTAQAPPPLGNSFSIIAPGGQGEFDRLQIVVRDCFGLLVAEEIAVDAKTREVEVPLGALGKVGINLRMNDYNCLIAPYRLTRFHSVLRSQYPWRGQSHEWCAQGAVVGSDDTANEVQIYCKPFHSRSITGATSRQEIITSLPDIPITVGGSSIWNEINGSNRNPAWVHLPVWHIVFACLFLCLLLPWRFPVCFPTSLLLILFCLVMQEKKQFAEALRTQSSGQNSGQARLDAQRELNLSRFHGSAVNETSQIRYLLQHQVYLESTHWK
jgi:hypothetical protein